MIAIPKSDEEKLQDALKDSNEKNEGHAWNEGSRR